MKVYARTKRLDDNNVVPYNYNIANAIDGALQLGLEVILYKNVEEIVDNIERGDLILDGVDQVNYCLKKFGIEAGCESYPDCLKKYLGRNIWYDTINHISRDRSTWGNFVKPLNREKAFTGKIINSTKDLIGCGSCYEDYIVACSEPVDFIYEVRAFVYYDEIIDVRPYLGSFKNACNLDPFVIESALSDFKKWKSRPNSCALDFGLTSDGRTLLVEMNFPYSLGCYGLNNISYIKLISAYIAQICGVKDEIKF